MSVSFADVNWSSYTDLFYFLIICSVPLRSSLRHFLFFYCSFVLISLPDLEFISYLFYLILFYFYRRYIRIEVYNVFCILSEFVYVELNASSVSDTNTDYSLLVLKNYSRCETPILSLGRGHHKRTQHIILPFHAACSTDADVTTILYL